MGVLGSKSENTVNKQTCKKDREQGKQICRFEVEEDGETKKQAIIEADLDENGQPVDVHENAAGYSDEEIKELKEKTKQKAEENADGGALQGNTEF